MAIVTRTRKKSKCCSCKNLILAALAAVVLLVLIDIYSGIISTYDVHDVKSLVSLPLVDYNVDYNVDHECKNLPSIRESGSYFLDKKIEPGSSSDNILPPFKVGSYYADKVPYHMAADAVMFDLIRDLLRGREGGLVVDIGANQGFFTYYLAALGMQVHSFEIDAANFRALQHGAEFNPRALVDRVHLYPVGLGQRNARFGMKGSNYEGFLEEGADGPILGVTFDCFAHHMGGRLDLRDVAFVKLDVEGFEIAVLKGAQNSLFKLGSSSVGGMLVEVGPDRWGRASVDLSTGVREMKNLSRHFKKSYVLLRTKGSYAKKCPLSLAKGILLDDKPNELDGATMYEVHINEWESLLQEMEKKHFDCNFFYKN